MTSFFPVMAQATQVGCKAQSDSPDGSTDFTWRCILKLTHESRDGSTAQGAESGVYDGVVFLAPHHFVSAQCRNYRTTVRCEHVTNGATKKIRHEMYVILMCAQKLA